MHELPDLSRLRRLSAAEKDALILAQFEQLKLMIAQIQTLSARVGSAVAQRQSQLEEAAIVGRVVQEAQVAAPIQRSQTWWSGRASGKHIEASGEPGSDHGAPMSSIRLNPLDAAWLFTESRATPNHVSGLLQFRLPAGASGVGLSLPAGHGCNICSCRRMVRTTSAPLP